MVTRTLTPAEQRHLTTDQQQYLTKRPNIVSLQADSMLLPTEQLYLTPRHGAVTVERAMALDAIHDAQLNQTSEEPVQDSYSDIEDSFIDRHGMSSGLS